jgi:hypothetical protein
MRPRAQLHPGAGGNDPPTATWPAWKDPTPISQSKSTRRPGPVCTSPGIPQAWVACRDLEPDSAPQLCRGPPPSPPPAIHSPAPPPPGPPSTPCRALDSQGQPRRWGARLGGIHCPKPSLCAVHKHSTSQSRARAPASPHSNPPAKEPAQPCPPPPMSRSPRSSQTSTIHSFHASPTLPRHFQILSSSLLPTPARYTPGDPYFPHLSSQQTPAC